MSIKFSLEGISFSYQGDILFYYWPFLSTKTRFYSLRLSSGFNSFNEYWKKIGILEENIKLRLSKIQGFSWEEILAQWLTTRINQDTVVTLYDLDLSAKPADFWASIPYEKRVELQKDVVIMKCKDLDQAINITESIDPNFGKSVIVSEGQIL